MLRQGRYKAILLEPDVLNKVCSYIHLNPYRAGIEEKGEIGSYRWSSLSCLPKKRIRPANLCADDALACIGGIKDSPYAWKKYKQYLEFLAEDEPEQRAQNFELFSKGWCVGSDNPNVSNAFERAGFISLKISVLWISV